MTKEEMVEAGIWAGGGVGLMIVVLIALQLSMAALKNVIKADNLHARYSGNMSMSTASHHRATAMDLALSWPIKMPNVQQQKTRLSSPVLATVFPMVSLPAMPQGVWSAMCSQPISYDGATHLVGVVDATVKDLLAANGVEFQSLDSLFRMKAR